MRRKVIFDPVFVLVVLFILIAANEALGQSNCRGHSCNDGGGVSVDTTVNLEPSATTFEGDRAFAFAHGLGDTDLGRGATCVVTTQWGTIVWSRQSYHYDLLCVSEKLDAQGKHEEAALLRCQIPDIRKAPWGKVGTSCQDAMLFKAPAPPDLGDLYDRNAQEVTETDDEDYRAAHERELVQQQAYLYDLEQRFDTLESKRRAGVARYKQDQKAQQDAARQALEQLPGPKDGGE